MENTNKALIGATAAAITALFGICYNIPPSPKRVTNYQEISNLIEQESTYFSGKVVQESYDARNNQYSFTIKTTEDSEQEFQAEGQSLDKIINTNDEVKLRVWNGLLEVLEVNGKKLR